MINEKGNTNKHWREKKKKLKLKRTKYALGKALATRTKVSLAILMALVKQILDKDDTGLRESMESETSVKSNSVNIEFL